MRHPEYILEQDLGKLIDAVATRAHMFFVPTMEEMVEAAKVIRPELPWTLSYPEDGEYEQLKAPPQTLELERAMRRAQRAPLRKTRGYSRGSINSVQDWMRRRGVQQRKIWGYGVYPEHIAEELHEEGYLETEPPKMEVEETLHKLVQELKQAERRHKKRSKRKKK